MKRISGCDGYNRSIAGRIYPGVLIKKVLISHHFLCSMNRFDQQHGFIGQSPTAILISGPHIQIVYARTQIRYIQLNGLLKTTTGRNCYHATVSGNTGPGICIVKILICGNLLRGMNSFHQKGCFFGHTPATKFIPDSHV